MLVLELSAADGHLLRVVSLQRVEELLLEVRVGGHADRRHHLLEAGAFPGEAARQAREAKARTAAALPISKETTQTRTTREADSINKQDSCWVNKSSIKI